MTARKARAAILGSALIAMALFTLESARAQTSFTCTEPDGSRSARIIGGEAAAPTDAPWQVSVGVFGPNGEYRHFCGGSLIGAQWVLTAAHCLWTSRGDRIPVESLVLRQGVTTLDQRGNERRVSAALPHPEYSARTKEHDIALLRLSAPIEGAQRSYARVMQPGPSGTFVFDGACAMVSGWGATVEGGRATNVLQRAEVPLITLDQCRQSYPGVTSNMVCAGYPQGQIDSCQGDSGGPLVVEGGPSGHVLAGVVSYGYRCARPGYPGVYTRVPAYAGWIIRTIQEQSR
jgi:secreted trypsin-like serine protease